MTQATVDVKKFGKLSENSLGTRVTRAVLARNISGRAADLGGGISNGRP